MARPPNRNTYDIRQHVTQYLSRENPESFSVPQLVTALYAIVGDVDITKALSNELQRRERAGYIAVIGSAERESMVAAQLSFTYKIGVCK